MAEWTTSPVFVTDAELAKEWREQTREEGDPRSDELRAEITRRELEVTCRKPRRLRKGGPFAF